MARAGSGAFVRVCKCLDVRRVCEVLLGTLVRKCVRPHPETTRKEPGEDGEGWR